jgi:glycosyltransferase involved in cell wall biosynthesis
VCHEANRTGVPLLLLQLIKWLKSNHKAEVFIILLRGGPLEPDFRKQGTVFLWNRAVLTGKRKNLPNTIANKASTIAYLGFRKPYLNYKLKKFNAEILYLNTAAALSFLHRYIYLFKRQKKILHCHEMPYTIKKYVPDSIQYLFNHMDRIIVVNKTTEQYLIERGVQVDKMLRVSEYFCKKFPSPVGTEPIDTFKVISAGLGSWRKGIDLFILCAYYFSKIYRRPFTFTWIGFIPPSTLNQLHYDIKKYGLADNMRFAGEVTETVDYFNKCDVFFLSSREDPYPLVMLEAAWFEKPVLYFNGTGGASEFINDAAWAVDAFDVYEAAQRLNYFADLELQRKEMGRRLKERVLSHTVENVGKAIFEFIYSDGLERTK